MPHMATSGSRARPNTSTRMQRLYPRLVDVETLTFLRHIAVVTAQRTLWPGNLHARGKRRGKR